MKHLAYYRYCQKANSAALRRSSRWYQSDAFWDDRQIDEYERMLTASRLKKEIKIIKRFIKRKKISIIDIPCGSGRISETLGSFGHSVVGVDNNKKFIQSAVSDAKIKKITSNVQYFRSDFLKFKQRNKYDLVLNIYSSIGYYESEQENVQMLRILFQLAKRGGTVIIEIFNPYRIIRNFSPQSTFKNSKGHRLVYTRTYDTFTSVNTTQVDKWAGKQRIASYAYSIRIYFPFELARIALENQCVLVEMLDEKGERGNLLQSERLWLIFKKDGI